MGGAWVGTLGRVVLGMLGLGVPGAIAHAQETPLEMPPVEPAAEPASFEGWGFIDRSPRPGRRYSDLAVHPADARLAIAVTQGGTAWLTIDGGDTWFPVLEADAARLGEESPDERVRQQIEAEVDDVLSDQGLGDLDEVISEEGFDEESAAEIVTERVEDAAEDVASQVQSEIDANPGFLVDQMGEAGAQIDATVERDPYRPQAWVLSDDRLFVARGDGLLVSDDLGATWDLVLTEPVNALAELPDGLLVAGTPRGFRTSDDGLAWSVVDDRTEALEVLDLVVIRGRAWAATSDGLQVSDDGRRWGPFGLLQGKARAIAIDPLVPGVAWVAFERTVFATRDAGNTFEPPREGDVPALVDLEIVGPDHLVGAGPNGAVESTDGGVTWTEMPAGLRGVDAWAVAVLDARVWLASDDGLSRLEPPEVLELRAAALGSLPEFVAFDALLDSAFEREGLGETLRRGARLRASAVPQVHFEGRWVPGGGLRYLDSQGTTRDESGGWTLMTWLEWTPAGRSGGTVDVLVTDGDVLIDSGSDQTMLAARMDRRAAEYRRKLADTVTELYYRRAVLVAERALHRTDPLVVRVDHELSILEVEARLDVITDGAVSAWRAGRAVQE